MKNLSSIILSTTNIALIIMWTYAGLVKLLNFSESRAQILNQPFPQVMSDILLYIIPIVELLIVILIFIPSVRKWGFVLSAFLLGLFSIYIILIKNYLFDRIPCSCGGIISGFSWTQHLIFNTIFLILSLLGLSLTIKERRINQAT